MTPEHHLSANTSPPRDSYKHAQNASPQKMVVCAGAFARKNVTREIRKGHVHSWKLCNWTKHTKCEKLSLAAVRPGCFPSTQMGGMDWIAAQ